MTKKTLLFYTTIGIVVLFFGLTLSSHAGMSLWKIKRGSLQPVSSGWTVGTSTTVFYGDGSHLSGVSGGGVSTSTPFSAGYIPLATSTSAITNSNIFQSGSYIGIGTTTPSYQLDVVGGARIDTLTLGTPLSDANVADDITASNYLPLTGGTMTGSITMPDGGTIGQPSTGAYIGFDDTNNQLELLGGNVGVGTNAPAHKLDVAGDLNVSATSTFSIFQLGTSATSGYVLTTDANGVGTWQAASGGGGLWTDAGTYTYLTATTSDLVVGDSSTSTAPLYLDVSSGDLSITGNITSNNYLYTGGQNEAVTQLTTSTTIYVDIGAGSDTTGDGSNANPYATVSHALDTLPTIINYPVDIRVRNGTSTAEQWDFSHFIIPSSLTIEAVDSTGTPMYGNGTVSTSTSDTLTDTSKAWDDNTLVGGKVFINHGTGGGQIRDISGNTSTTITVSSAWTTTPAVGDEYVVVSPVRYDGNSAKAFWAQIKGKKNINIKGFQIYGYTSVSLDVQDVNNLNVSYCAFLAGGGVNNMVDLTRGYAGLNYDYFAGPDYEAVNVYNASAYANVQHSFIEQTGTAGTQTGLHMLHASGVNVYHSYFKNWNLGIGPAPLEIHYQKLATFDGCNTATSTSALPIVD